MGNTVAQMRCLMNWNTDTDYDIILTDKAESQEVMTDKQLDIIFQVFDMILDGCKDLDEAKKKVKELRGEKDEKENEREE